MKEHLFLATASIEDIIRFYNDQPAPAESIIAHLPKPVQFELNPNIQALFCIMQGSGMEH